MFYVFLHGYSSLFRDYDNYYYFYFKIMQVTFFSGKGFPHDVLNGMR